jgi:ankyrin repeat protein
VKGAEALPDELETFEPTPEAEFAARQQRQWLAVAIADLPQHERVVVHLAYLAGTSQDDIAVALGIPLNTVKSRLHSARGRLGQQLLGTLAASGSSSRARESLEFVQRVRLFRAIDQRDLATLALLLDATPRLAHERRRREDERVAAVRWGVTPLHLAAAAGDAAMAELLIEHGADLEADNRGPSAPRGGTPLYVAAAWGRVEVVELLLARGAAVYGAAGANPLRAAIVHDHYPAVAQRLLDAGAEPTIFEAVALGDERLVATMLAAGPSLVAARLDGEARESAPTTHTPLHIAARKNLPGMARLLLRHAADPAAVDASNRTPVDQALVWGHAEVFRELVAAGASPAAELVAQVHSVERARSMQHLLTCLFERDLEAARALLDADASLARARLPTFWPDNYVGGTALHLAAWLDLRSFIDVLLDYGADLQARDERYGGTPMQWAEENSQYETAEYLRKRVKNGG